jgi:general secretion pathway protein D
VIIGLLKPALIRKVIGPPEREKMAFVRSGLISLLCTLLTACTTQLLKPSEQHINSGDVSLTRAAGIPPVLTRTIPLSLPVASPKVQTYSVVVTNVPVQEILFALARDAKINLDIQNGIQGTVTLNAIDQSLPRILGRMAKQVDMRYELDGTNLIIMPDTPFLKYYKIDYVNMARDAEGTISNATQVGSGASGSTAGNASGNSSSLTIKNTSRNHFWETLTQNIKDILHETDMILPAGSSETVVQKSNETSSIGNVVPPPSANGKKKAAAKAPATLSNPIPSSIQEDGTTVTRTSTFREAAAVIANPESGIITVRASGKQHEKIRMFVDQVMTSVRRQVLIEATVVEVRLNEQYQQGINWSQLRLGSTGFQFNQSGSAGLPASNTGSMFTIGYANPSSLLGNLSAQISLLESFGKVKVLSSPKLSVMNNQTAMLRVVDNLVYFVTNTTTTAPTATSAAFSTFSTTPNIVPIGFTMSVTPQINDNDTVLLNLRPSISRLLGYVNDPNPDLANAHVVSRIPQTQTREMESVLKIENNQIAVMGGLMQDEVNNLTDTIPGLSAIPLLGNLFMNRNDNAQKTELVIFLRPVVLKEASVNADFGAFRSSLPDADFFKPANNGGPKDQGMLLPE